MYQAEHALAEKARGNDVKTLVVSNRYCRNLQQLSEVPAAAVQCC